MDKIRILNCNGCEYYYITWDIKHPKGCKLFGFKSVKLPCIVVKESTGKMCSMYTPKQQNEN